MANVFISQSDIDTMNGLGIYAVVNGVVVDVPTTYGAMDNIIFKCKSGYEFVDDRYGGYNEGIWEQVTVEDNKTETTEKALYFIPEDINFFEFTTVSNVLEVVDFVKQSDLDYASYNNFNILLNGVQIVEPTQAKKGDVLTLETKDGYSFVDNSYGYYLDGVWQTLTPLVDFKSFQITLVGLPKGVEDFIPKIETLQDKPEIMGEVNHLYKVDKENLRALNDKRFYEIRNYNGESATFDYSKFIINLLMFPFELPANIIGNKEKIVLAEFVIDSQADAITKDNIFIDMGRISVPKPANFIGYGVNLLLHLPFSSPISIDVVNCLGEELEISLVLNAYTGLGTYDIKSSSTNESIHNFTLDLGINIPFANNAFEPNLYLSSDLQTGGDNFIRTPFIEMVDYSNAGLNMGQFNTPIKDYGIIGQQTGFIKVEDALIDFGLNMEETYMIMEVLKDGVFL